MWQLYKYQPINKVTISNLLSRRLWAARTSSFNDPFDFRLRREGEVTGLDALRRDNPHFQSINDQAIIQMAINKYQQDLENMGVVCFTEVPDSILMWAHYANAHCGLCLGFCGDEDFDKLPSTKGIHAVRYSEDYPTLDFSKVWFQDGLAQILWTKYIAWKYEKEWRLIRVGADSPINYPGKLNRVIFGLRTSEDDRETVQRILLHEELQYFKVVQDEGKYKLHLKEM